MNMDELLDLVNKDKRMKNRVKSVQLFTIGLGIVVTVGFGLVAVAGVAAGIIFAPKSGKETRADMKKKAVNTVENIKDTVQNKAETVSDSAADTVQKACNVLKDVQEKAEDAKTDKLFI